MTHRGTKKKKSLHSLGARELGKERARPREKRVPDGEKEQGEVLGTLEGKIHRLCETYR